MFLDAVRGRALRTATARRYLGQEGQRVFDGPLPASSSSSATKRQSGVPRSALDCPPACDLTPSLSDNVALQANAHDVCTLSRARQPTGFTNVHFKETVRCVRYLPANPRGMLNNDNATPLLHKLTPSHRHPDFPVTHHGIPGESTAPPHPAPPSQSAGAHESRDYYASQA